MAKDSLIEYKDLVSDDGTFEKLSAQIKKSKEELLDLAKVSKKAFAKIKPGDLAGMDAFEKKVTEIEMSERNLIKTEKALQKAKKKTIDLTNQELIQLEKNKLIQRERIQVAKQVAILQKQGVGKLEKLRAELALSTLSWKRLTSEQIKNNSALDKSGRTAKDVIKQKTRLTKELKKLEKQTGDNRRNVGNYSSALQGLNGVMIGFGGNIGASLGALTGMAGGIRTATKGMKLFRLAIISTGIGALVLGIISLVSYFKRSQKGIEMFSQGLAVVGAVVNVILDRFMKLGSALVAVFTGDFAGAMDIATDAVSGLGDEISRTAKEALSLEKAIQDLSKIELYYSRGLAKRMADIATLRREAKEIQDKDAASALKKLQKAQKLQEEIGDIGIKVAKDKLVIAQREHVINTKNQDALKKVYDAEIAVKRAIELRAGATRMLQREINTLALREEARIRKEAAARLKASQMRLKALGAVIKAVEKLEIEGIEDKQERLEALEMSRFKEEQKLKKLQFEQDKILFKNHAVELALIIDKHNELTELQEEDHQQKLFDIKKLFIAKTIEIQSFTADEFNAQAKAEADALKKSNEEKLGINKDYWDKIKEGTEANTKFEEAQTKKRADDIKKSTDELIKGIQQTAQKIGAVIVDLYEKQADLSEKSVERQEDSLSRARDRAQKGYSANLAFEEQELAKRQLEQQRRQKEAEQAAKILTLFNLVSAYAAGGDKNALARGLIDFSLLTALSAGIGFEEGGYTGSDGSNSAVKGVVHANEYVVTASDTARFGLTGKDGGQFGEAMGDYFDPQSPIQQNPYSAQKEAFKQTVKTQVSGNSEMVRELKAIKSHLAKQPNIGIEIEQVYENVYTMIKKESKQTITKISKKFLRAK